MNTRLALLKEADLLCSQNLFGVSDQQGFHNAEEAFVLLLSD